MLVLNARTHTHRQETCPQDYHGVDGRDDMHATCQQHVAVAVGGGGGSRCHSQGVGVRCSRLLAEEGLGWGALAEQRLERGDALVCVSIMCLSVPII